MTFFVKKEAAKGKDELVESDYSEFKVDLSALRTNVSHDTR